MFHVTADTNIYISALNFDGVQRRLLAAARLRFVELAISEALLDEVRRVLRDKFAWLPAAIASAVDRLLAFAQRVEPTLRLDVIARDPSDNRVLECAVAAGSRFIVTGDNDLLSLGTYEGIRIMKVAAFLECAQLPASQPR